MARKYGSGKQIQEIDNKTQRKIEKEKEELLTQPTDNDPAIHLPRLEDWRGMEKTRLNAIKAIESSLAKSLKLLAALEKEKDIDPSKLFAILSENTKHAFNLCKSIDSAIPNFYDPKEQALDTKLEVIVTYEPE